MVTGKDNSSGARTFETLETTAMSWQPTGTPGFWRKVLHEDHASGRSTSMVRIDPESVSPSHAHDLREQVFVLEGAFSDQSDTYQAGDFVVREPGTQHTATSDKGALLLVVF